MWSTELCLTRTLVLSLLQSLFAESKERLITGALQALIGSKEDNAQLNNVELEASFHVLRRLLASKVGFAAFTNLPGFREAIGLKVVHALKRNDLAVTYAAIDMINSLMHSDHDLKQEQLNKSSLLHTKVPRKLAANGDSTDHTPLMQTPFQTAYEFVLNLRKDKKIDTIKLSSENRNEILTSLLKYRTMFLCFSSFSRQISRSAELGTPSSSSSSRTRFRATISSVSRFLPLNTVPYVPSPIFSSFSYFCMVRGCCGRW